MIKLNEKIADGRTDWKDLKLHYEGTGIYALDVKLAKKTLDNLIYTGERPPSMHWTKFEQQLNGAFATYMKVEKQIVHSNQMKLLFLVDKVKCDILNPVTTALSVTISNNKNFTYNEALKVYKAAVHWNLHREQRMCMPTSKILNQLLACLSSVERGHGMIRSPDRPIYW